MTEETITVANVKFSAEQVKEAILCIDGREVHIKECNNKSRLGFTNSSSTEKK